MDREKVIKGLEVCSSIADGESCPKDCPYYQDVCYGYDQLMRDALALLKEQEPHVLTWDEMVEAGKNHEAVYLEEHENAYQKRFWGIAVEGIEPPERGYNYPGGTQFNVVDADDDMWDGDLYGLDTPLGWRAWNRKPTEEQMKAVPWK